MRGHAHQPADRFSYLSPEQRVRPDHPWRAIRALADRALSSLAARFDRMYAQTGRPSIAPEQWLRAPLLQMLYSIRRERLLMEESDYSVLFCWFVGMNLDQPLWDVQYLPRTGIDGWRATGRGSFSARSYGKRRRRTSPATNISRWMARW